MTISGKSEAHKSEVCCSLMHDVSNAAFRISDSLSEMNLVNRLPLVVAGAMHFCSAESFLKLLSEGILQVAITDTNLPQSNTILCPSLDFGSRTGRHSYSTTDR